MTTPEDLARELEADRGANRKLDARIAVALYDGGGHADPRDNTTARLPSALDDCAPGTYWISAFSGLSLRTAPDYTSDRTLKRLALTALQAQPAPQGDVVEAVRELIRDAYVDGATAVHNAWVDGTNGREPDFGEAASDYTAFAVERLASHEYEDTYPVDWEEIEQWVEDGCPEGVAGMPDNIRSLIATVKQSLTVRLQPTAQSDEAIEAAAKAHCDFFGGDGWWDSGLLADTKPRALEAMRIAIQALQQGQNNEQQ